MADRIIKGDSGNDVIIQNNDASRKIEVTNSGDVEITGDVKTTNLKATNLKANDGTASLEVADSTGDIGFSGNTNLKIKLPSAGGVFESDGSTEILTESSGAVTLKNTTIDSTVVFPAGGTGNAISVAIICDEKEVDTPAGSSTGDGFQDRELNTTISDPDSLVTVDPTNRQFTIGAGTYLIEFSAPMASVNRHHARLWDQTAGEYVTKGSGTSEYTANSNSVQTRTFGSVIVTPTSNNIYRIKHYSATAVSNIGLGVDVENTGSVSIFTIVKITKLK